MLIRIVRLTFAPEKVGDFLHLFETSKVRIRQRPGCRHLELWRDVANPSVFTTYSHWDTEEHLNAYRDSQLFGEVWPATKKLFAAPPVAFTVEQLAVMP
jgi:quinol monooxygenase YgiN